MTLLDTLQTAPGQLIPAAGDGNTLNLLTNSEAPAILLDATLATKTLLAEENPGLLTISEYATFLRDMQLKKTAPLIADLQSGFGNPLLPITWNGQRPQHRLTCWARHGPPRIALRIRLPNCESSLKAFGTTALTVPVNGYTTSQTQAPMPSLSTITQRQIYKR